MQLLGGKVIANLGKIAFFHLMAGMQHPLDHVPIIGKQQQAFAIKVQPSCRYQANRIVPELVQHCGAAFWVLYGGYLTDGFIVKQIMLFLFQMDDLAVHRYAVRFLHLYAHLGDFLPVDRHMAFGNQLFRRASGRYAALGQILLQAHGFNLFPSSYSKTAHMPAGQGVFDVPPASGCTENGPHPAPENRLLPETDTLPDSDRLR